MNEKRREILLGYLLGALEPREEVKVEQELQRNDSLQQDLAELYREIAPVMSVVHCYPPPSGLAKRTSQNLWEKIDARQKRAPNSENESNSEKQSDEKPFAGTVPQPHFPEKLPLQPDRPRPSRHKITVEVSEAPERNFVVQKPENDAELPNDKQVVTKATDSVSQDTDGQTSETTHVIHSLHPATPPPLSARSNMSALLSETPSLIITKQPKYYGKQDAVSQKKRTRKKRDAIVSVLLGIAVSIGLYFSWQNGIAYVREAIYQKKIREFGQNLPAGSSQYSTYGISPNDLMLVNNMNLDSDSAARYQQLRNDNQLKEQPSPLQQQVISSDGK